MYLDSDVLTAIFKTQDYHKQYAEKIVSTEGRKYTSIITFVEAEITINRDMGVTESLQFLEIILQKVPDLKIVELTEKIFAKSLELRGKFGLTIYDSIHAATCLENDGIMASTDKSYQKIKEIKIVK